MCRIRILLTIVCLSLVLVFAPGSVPGAQAAPTSPDTTVLTPNWHFETDQATDSSSRHRELTVASGCDVNGDGYEDVLVGDRDHDPIRRVSSGKAWLFYGGRRRLERLPCTYLRPARCGVLWGLWRATSIVIWMSMATASMTS